MESTPIPTGKALAQLCRLASWGRVRALAARQRFSLVLMSVGLLLLGYVGSEYWTMHSEQQSLYRQWEQQQNQQSTASPTEIKVNDDGLTRVSIPKIALDVVLVEGTNHKALRLGPGHLKQTPAPGEPGNSVISAHRDTFFRHIYELGKGDEIQVRRNGRTYLFQVTGKKIVKPDDLSVVQNSPDTRLTLITCYPIYYIGPAPERLVVFSKLVADAPHRAESKTVGQPNSGQGS